MIGRRQYTASAYTIDFEKHSVLLVYNTKLKKWLQPGGHIFDIDLELPWDTAVRETKVETGIDIKNFVRSISTCCCGTLF